MFDKPMSNKMRLNRILGVFDIWLGCIFFGILLEVRATWSIYHGLPPLAILSESIRLYAIEVTTIGIVILLIARGCQLVHGNDDDDYDKKNLT